jgi:hypothetical protein
LQGNSCGRCGPRLPARRQPAARKQTINKPRQHKYVL